MTPFRLAAMLLMGLLVAACGQEQSAALRPAQEPGADAVGTICRMALSEHGGPKGQIFLAGQDKPLWFSSVRDTFTWLMIDGGGGLGMTTIWVNDMGRSKVWAQPEAGAWVEARKAIYVAGSVKGAEMGGAELVPFSDRAAAEAFIVAHGGTVLAFSQITRDVLAGLEQTAVGSGERP